jgi:hypothetical protein
MELDELRNSVEASLLLAVWGTNGARRARNGQFQSRFEYVVAPICYWSSIYGTAPAISEPLADEGRTGGDSEKTRESTFNTRDRGAT